MASDNEYLLSRLKEHRSVQRRRGQVHQALGLSIVIKALKRFPLPVTSAKVALLLQGVGQSYAELIGQWLADKPRKRLSEETPVPAKSTKLSYAPGSPLWTTLLCCLEAPSPFTTKTLQSVHESIQKTCSCPFPEDIDGVLRTLLEHQDLELSSSGFVLTAKGSQLALQLRNRQCTASSPQIEEPAPDPDSWFAALTEPQAVEETAGVQADVVLLVDTAERLTDDFAFFSVQLEQRGIRVEKQKLWIGDYHWVARSGDLEYSLGLVVERKAAQDLAASIVDGRYQAQKRRLKDSGAQCVYLLEGAAGRFQTLSHDSLLTALVSTMLKHDFQVKTTRNVHETANWLGRVTQALLKRTLGLSPTEWTKLQRFELFQELSNPARTATLQSVFGRQLRGLPNCGAQATEALLRHFPVPRLLHEALQCKLRARKQLFKVVLLANGSKLQKRIIENLLELFCGTS